MARKVQVLLVDDLDGADLGTKGETVAFGLGGERYELDLSPQNAEKFYKIIEPYKAAARNVTRIGSGKASSRRVAAGSTGGHNKEETRAARQWLVDHGHLSPDSRGRISAENWERYRNRNQQTTPAKASNDTPTEKPTATSSSNSTKPAKAEPKVPASAGA